MSLTSAVWVLLFLLCIWHLSSIPRNYRLAQKSGLPIVIGPLSPANPIWLIVVALFGYLTISSIIPRSIFNLVKYTISGWEHYDRHFDHEKSGGSFILVSPGQNTIFTADPEIGMEVLTRRKEFGRIIEIAAREFT